MANIQTRYFGELECPADSRLHFAAGIPGFESEHWFVLLEQPHTKPLAFLQSLADPRLCFTSLPVLVVDPGYKPCLSPEDLDALGLPADRQPRIGAEVLCVALVTVLEGQSPTANLLAPIVVNLNTREAVQAIRAEPGGYSHQHSLAWASQEAACL